MHTVRLEAEVSTFVPLLDTEQVQRLPAGAREVVEYRKSGLSLNHIQGCPLDCAYCIRHTYGLWDQRQPRALMPDVEAVERLVSHRYFQAHVTPVRLALPASSGGSGPRPGPHRGTCRRCPRPRTCRLLLGARRTMCVIIVCTMDCGCTDTYSR